MWLVLTLLIAQFQGVILATIIPHEDTYTPRDATIVAQFVSLGMSERFAHFFAPRFTAALKRLDKVAQEIALYHLTPLSPDGHFKTVQNYLVSAHVDHFKNKDLLIHTVENGYLNPPSINQIDAGPKMYYSKKMGMEPRFPGTFFYEKQ